MSVLPKGDFLYLPGPNPAHGTVYSLGTPVREAITPCFLLVPYCNGNVQTPTPRFYPLLGKTAVKDFLCKDQVPETTVKPCTSREEYLNHISSLRNHIQRGNVYEVNYCVRFEGKGEINPLSVFFRLAQASEAPYLMLARLGNEYILCASPELFLKKEGNNLITKPIKGTIRRGNTFQVDEMLKTHLSKSIKERTENVMAVDVARNDLSMIASRGSVQVPALFDIETFKTVHQMVTTVTCQLQEGTGINEIIRATFPMASMTGAPKLSAMKLIDEHESFSRSYYSGTMGLIDENGDFTLPVIIRSLFYNVSEQKFWFATGGAITFLSEAVEEYDECLLKASTMLRALNATLEN